MTLEDFFTLTEMKNGLTTCARVEELIYVMQKQNCSTNNVGDATRQWSTAASTLTLTQNRECLDLFVHLNGLDFLNFWLQEADKYSRDVTDGEDLINALLTSLDKLPMNLEKIISSGIFATVEKLVCHVNINIMEKAKILVEKWKINDDNLEEMEKDSSYPVDHLKPSSDTASIVEEEVGSEGRCKIESGRTLNPQIVSDYALQLGDADEVEGSTHNQTSPARSSNKIENHMLLTSSVPDGCRANISVHEASCLPSTGIPFSTTPTSPEIQVTDDERCDISVRSDIKSDLNKGKCDSWEFRETSSVVSSYAKNPTVVRSASCNLALKEGESDLSEKTLHRCASVDCVWLEYSKTVKELNLGENGSLDLLDLPTQGSLWREEAAENTSDVERSDEPTLQTCKGVDRLIYGASSVQATRKIASSSDSDTESGEIDALEIARQVAIQVEREVVDYREELCSSSPEVSSNETMNADSPSIEPTKLCYPIPGEANGYVSVPFKDNSECTSSPKDNNHMVTEVNIDPSKEKQNMETPNGAAVIHESIATDKHGNFDFDLNEEASIEDIDCAVNPLYSSRIVNLSTPVAVFASKGPPGFHTTPLCFEGGLGWRGSAATSAFRPASPRKTMNGEKSDSGSIFKGSLLGLDLNVCDCENFLSMDMMKEVPISSSIPSWNSTSEFSSPRAERLKLDLNSNGEEEATPSQSSFIKHHFLNRDQSSSPPSSSPPPRQSSHKNFDLNDNLFFSDVAVSKNILGIKIDDPVMTNMGSTMSFESRIHTSEAHQPYMGSGMCFEATLATRPLLPYSHQISHPGFGYIGTATGVALPFQPAVYGFGNIQHMMDSRGATAFPQLLSSAGTNGGPLATPPFLMSITGAPSSSNVGGPSQMGLDLNFGMIQKMENGPSEEQFKTASQQGTSANSLKRKEPDSGWEPYSFGYKHVTSWH